MAAVVFAGCEATTDGANGKVAINGASCYVAVDGSSRGALVK